MSPAFEFGVKVAAASDYVAPVLGGAALGGLIGAIEGPGKGWKKKFKNALIGAGVGGLGGGALHYFTSSPAEASLTRSPVKRRFPVSDKHTAREDARFFYGNDTDEEIAAATEAQKNRPSDVDMSMFSKIRPEDYDAPHVPLTTDPAKQFGPGSTTRAYYAYGPGTIHLGPDVLAEGPNSSSYQATLAHERMHAISTGDSDKTLLPYKKIKGLPNDVLKMWQYQTMPTEITTRAAEIRRNYTRETGKPVRTHEDAQNALEWFRDNVDKLPRDTVSSQNTANFFLGLPEKDRKKILQRMLEVAKTNFGAFDFGAKTAACLH